LVLGSAHGAAPDAAATDAGAWVMGGTKSSPSGTIQPMQAPTGSTSPSDAAMNFKTPEAGASTSIAALSVSISNSVAPLTTCAPSAACQRPIRPELMSMSTRGMTISTAMSDLGQRQTPGRRDNVVRLRNGRLLQDRAIGNRRLDAAEPHDRRVEIVERLALGDDGGNFRPDAERLDALVDREQPPRRLDAGHDRVFVDRPQAA